MTTHTLIAAGLLVGLLSAVGGFIVGWIAHRDDNHRYQASRRAHLAHLADLERLAERAHPPRCDVAREVVYVPVPVSTPVPVPVPVAGLGLGWVPVTGTPIGDRWPALPPVRLDGEDR